MKKNNKVVKKVVGKDGKAFFVDENGEKIDSAEGFIQEIVDENGNTVYI